MGGAIGALKREIMGRDGLEGRAKGHATCTTAPPTEESRRRTPIITMCPNVSMSFYTPARGETCIS